ncbi:molybdopterin-dependent oxidoreductase [Agromyces marinus]|uniref:molybdopterin-dependent oxidoreductase n=1 Tax=Agromyces marinus TaxID=1389020 RepID=UPI001F3E1E88|nr:molybdopterin-dependent oxidoreductase [Agromyces marinus]UIP60024.1 Protein-methionine-sulfoxide reductase catalytic subunit MsrP [Agromyces marinus]
MSRRTRAGTAWAAVAGVVGAGVFLAVTWAVGLFGPPGSDPILAVGAFVIDITPQPLKEFAIATFGFYDKIVLIAALIVAAIAGAAIAGILQFRRPPWGVVLLAVAVGASIAAILTRGGATPLAAVPPLVGGAAGCAVLALLAARLRRWRSATDATATAAPTGDERTLARRSFFVMSAVAAVSAVAVGAGARVAEGARSSITAIRRALRLPAPEATVTVPEGADLGIRGLSPLYTPNDEFYRVDTALTVPQVDPTTWRLVVDGRVDEPFELSFDDLVGMGLDEYSITLTCVSNEVGGDLVGTALWWGVPVREILRRARPHGDADMVLSHSIDGFTASTPLAALTDDGLDAILAVAMNGEPLPLDHGFPVRMVVPGLYGYVSATKWLTRLQVTTFAEDEAYWTPRGYSAQAPIKFSSRIDTPRPGTSVEAGRVALAGVAWAQGVGIDRVEVRIDEGEWQAATLSVPVNADTWVQWALPWDATPGTHFVTVRAVNAAGEVQTADRAPIAPDGSTGRQRVLLTVV